MPLDRRRQSRFKLAAVINAQVVGQNGNPVGSTISGFLQDISIGGACFTAQNLKKDLGKKLLAETIILSFLFEKDPPISVSGQIVDADFDDSNSSYTIRLQFTDQCIKENLNKLIDICKRLKKPSESKAIQLKLKQETHANADANFSSLGSLMDELSRVQRKLADENASYIDDEVIEIPTISNESLEESIKITPEETSKTKEMPPLSFQPCEKVASLIQDIKKDPKNLGLIQKLVDLCISEKLYGDAIESLKAVIEVNPREAELQLLLGDTHFQAENFQESLKPLNMALRLNPKLARAHYIFSMANELVGEEEVSQKHYRIATMLDPNIESKV